MRLIDADKLIEKLLDFKEWENDDGRPIHTMSETQRIDRCINFVQMEQTAYDFDKVVKELEKELSLADKEKERCTGKNHLQFDSAKGYASGISTAIEIVKAGGGEYNDGWIPCSERFPKDDSICIVTVEYPNKETVVDYGWFDKKGICWYVGMQEFRTSNVLAWKPLPEPYKGVKKDEK